MAFQGKVQSLWRHTISSHLFWRTLLASASYRDRAVMELLFHMKLPVITGDSHRCMSLYSQGTWRWSTFLSPTAPSLSYSMTRCLKEHWALGVSPYFPFNSQLSGRLTSPPASPSLHWTHFTYDLGSICHRPTLLYFGISLSCWLSLTAPSSDFPLPASLSLTSPLCLPLKCWLPVSFLDCWLTSLNTLYIFSLSCLIF